jgi:hypothetical protein
MYTIGSNLFALVTRNSALQLLNRLSTLRVPTETPLNLNSRPGEPISSSLLHTFYVLYNSVHYCFGQLIKYQISLIHCCTIGFSIIRLGALACTYVGCKNFTEQECCAAASTAYCICRYRYICIYLMHIRMYIFVPT